MQMSQMKLREGVPSTQNPRHADKTCKVFKAVKSVVYLELKRNQRGWSGVKEKEEEAEIQLEGKLRLAVRTVGCQGFIHAWWSAEGGACHSSRSHTGLEPRGCPGVLARQPVGCGLSQHCLLPGSGCPAWCISVWGCRSARPQLGP